MNEKQTESSNIQLFKPLQDMYPEEYILQVIDDSYGNKKLVCENLSCNFSQLQRFCETHPKCRIELRRAKEMLVSKAELVLLDALMSRNEQTRLDAAKATLKLYGSQFGLTQGTKLTPTAVSFENTGESGKKMKIQAIFGISSSEKDDDDELGEAEIVG